MDDVKKIAEEMADRHEEWNGIVKKNEKKWLSEFKVLLGKGERFWGTTFSTFTMFKVFEHVFKDTIDECFNEVLDNDRKNVTRTDIAYGLFGEVVEEGERLSSSEGGIA